MKCKRHNKKKPCALCLEIAKKAKATREYWDGLMEFHTQPNEWDLPRWGSHEK